MRTRVAPAQVTTKAKQQARKRKKKRAKARKAAAKHEAWGQTFYYHEYREGGHSVGSDHEEDAKRAALLLAYLNREIGTGAQ